MSNTRSKISSSHEPFSSALISTLDLLRSSLSNFSHVVAIDLEGQDAVSEFGLASLAPSSIAATNHIYFASLKDFIMSRQVRSHNIQLEDLSKRSIKYQRR